MRPGGLFAQGRRDERRGLGPGDGWVDLPPDTMGPAPLQASLSTISIAGLSFRLDVAPDPGLDVGAVLSNVTVRIDGHAIDGDLTVMTVHHEGDSSFAAGCFFYPQTEEGETAWLALLGRMERGSSSEATSSQGPLLAFRCGSCHRSILADKARLVENQPVVLTCETCSEEHTLNSGANLLGIDELRSDAHELARQSLIDLPGAYSVLLGIMSLAQVTDMYSADRAAETPPAPATLCVEYDSAFEEAVEAGRLTIEQAIHRGDRAAFASRTAERHGLPMPLALEVADNRLSLLQAVRQRGARTQAPASPQNEPSGTKPLRAAFVAVLLVSAIFVGAYVSGRVLNRVQGDQQATVFDQRHRIMQGTRVAKDESGNTVEIGGPNPESVLMAYCRPGRHGELEIALPDPPQTGLRWGIFTDRDVPGSRLAIQIQRTSGAREWVAGNGSDPITVSEAPDLPENTARYPVR